MKFGIFLTVSFVVGLGLFSTAHGDDNLGVESVGQRAAETFTCGQAYEAAAENRLHGKKSVLVDVVNMAGNAVQSAAAVVMPIQALFGSSSEIWVTYEESRAEKFADWADRISTLETAVENYEAEKNSSQNNAEVSNIEASVKVQLDPKILTFYAEIQKKVVRADGTHLTIEELADVMDPIFQSRELCKPDDTEAIMVNNKQQPLWRLKNEKQFLALVQAQALGQTTPAH